MKKMFLLFVIALFFASCADEKEINGVVYRPYGLLNENECKNDSIFYETSTEAVISGIVFCETVIVPIYTFGFNLYQPVCTTKEIKNKKGTR